MIHKVWIEKKALAFLNQLTDKTKKIIKEKLKTLQDNPYPELCGDKELLCLPGDYKLYRLHISRSYTIFYIIDERQNLVRILDIMTIERAHKKYGKM